MLALISQSSCRLREIKAAASPQPAFLPYFRSLFEDISFVTLQKHMGDIDEGKLSAWLGELGLESPLPAQLRTAKLGPLWSFLGVAKTVGVKSADKQESVSHDISLFPSTTASEDLQLTKVEKINKLSSACGRVKHYWKQQMNMSVAGEG